MNILTDEEARDIAVQFDIDRDWAHQIANSGAKKVMEKSADNLLMLFAAAGIGPADALRTVAASVGPCVPPYR